MPINVTHGMSYTSTYTVWQMMRQRCNNENKDNYEDYGGRGISVCPRWNASFENFFEDMGEHPKGRTLDRKDCNGNYEPENCRWATKEEQDNNRNSTKRITFRGEILSYTQWARKLGGDDSLISARLRRGWTNEHAVNTPRGERRK